MGKNSTIVGRHSERSLKITQPSRKVMATGTISKNMVLLWENSSVNNAFTSQTVSLDLSKCSAVLILFRHWVGADVYNTWTAFVGQSGNIATIQSSSNIGILSARMYDVTTTGVVFYEGKGLHPTSGTYTDNSGAIPIAIYGIKA